MERNEVNANAMGGTELMALRIERDCNRSLLDQVQIIHSRPRELDKTKKSLLVLHDLPQDPEVQHLKTDYRKYDGLVFVSHWQQQMYNMVLGIPYDAGFVIHNGIEPIPEVKKPDNVIKLIYHSTPHRGLELLYPAFDELSKEFTNIELDVYSSFALYGWKERDRQYEQLIKKLERHPKINYHGAVSNDEIRKALQQAHIFAFPSIWTETSCLCLMEAMSAGLVCVHSSLGALPETSMSLTNMYGYSENKQAHLNTFYTSLHQIISSFNRYGGYEAFQNSTSIIKKVSDVAHGWDSKIPMWNEVMKYILTS